MSAENTLLWNEHETKSLLGESGYSWFVQRAEREIAKCKHSGSVPIRCQVCTAKAQTLIAFTKVYFDTVPLKYRHITLRTLQPYPSSPVPLERQAHVIGTLKADPNKSYAFFGPPGSGKTVWATTLYSEMLYRQYTEPRPRWKWFPVRRTSITKMVEQHADYAVRRNNPDWTDLDRRLNAPDVTADKIRAVTQTGDKYHLFLEDVNGGDLTATSRAILFEVVNAVYENEGQLVITSNLTPAEFKRQYGEDLYWRIVEHCTIVNLFDEADKK
jgi:DNA replication protein DnaC